MPYSKKKADKRRHHPDVFLRMPLAKIGFPTMKLLICEYLLSYFNFSGGASMSPLAPKMVPQKPWQKSWRIGSGAYPLQDPISTGGLERRPICTIGFTKLFLPLALPHYMNNWNSQIVCTIGSPTLDVPLDFPNYLYHRISTWFAPLDFPSYLYHWISHIIRTTRFSKLYVPLDFPHEMHHWISQIICTNGFPTLYVPQDFPNYMYH